MGQPLVGQVSGRGTIADVLLGDEVGLVQAGERIAVCSDERPQAFVIEDLDSVRVDRGDFAAFVAGHTPPP
jgi:hypothetical protein